MPHQHKIFGAIQKFSCKYIETGKTCTLIIYIFFVLDIMLLQHFTSSTFRARFVVGCAIEHTMPIWFACKRMRALFCIMRVGVWYHAVLEMTEMMMQQTTISTTTLRGKCPACFGPTLRFSESASNIIYSCENRVISLEATNRATVTTNPRPSAGKRRSQHPSCGTFSATKSSIFFHALK